MTEESSRGSLPWPFSLFASMTPRQVVESILPGWFFANAVSITYKNSSAPDIENDIVAEENYGRQLGRVIAALSDLIKEKSVSEQTKEMQELLNISEKIKRIKTENVERCLQNMKAWLLELNGRDIDNYRYFVLSLNENLDTDSEG